MIWSHAKSVNKIGLTVQLILKDNNFKSYVRSSKMKFNSNDFKPLPTSYEQNWCGGTGDMLAFSPDGVMYPCIRYMESSLGDDMPPIIIGNLDEGLYATEHTKELKKYFDTITRRS